MQNLNLKKSETLYYKHFVYRVSLGLGEGLG